MVPPTSVSSLGPAVLVPPAAVDLLDRAARGAHDASAVGDPGERFVLAHLAALRAGAAVLAVRGRPRTHRRGPLNVWDAMGAVAPELASWVPGFVEAALRRAAVEAGRARAVTPEEADAHLARAEAFTAAVADLLGCLPLAVAS